MSKMLITIGRNETMQVCRQVCASCLHYAEKKNSQDMAQIISPLPPKGGKKAKSVV